MAVVERIQSPERIPSPDIQFGKYIPPHLITNQHFEDAGIQTASGDHLTAARIEKSVGVLERSVATFNPTGEEETQAYMAEQAARDALKGEKDVDVVFISSSYPMGVNLAEHVREKLGLSEKVDVMEFGAACSGYTYMLNFLYENEEYFKGKNILLGASERYHPTLVNILKLKHAGEDPSMALTIFADGSVVSFWRRHGKHSRVLGSMNRQFDEEISQCIRMPIDRDLIRQPYKEVRVPHSDDFFRQNGKEVYERIKENIAQVVWDTVLLSGVDSKEIKFLIPHQGSIHMLKGVAGQLPEYAVLCDIREGNFSSASIPKALMKAVQGTTMEVFRGKDLTKEHVQLQKGDIVVLAGFGAGLFASVAVVQL